MRWEKKNKKEEKDEKGSAKNKDQKEYNYERDKSVQNKINRMRMTRKMEKGENETMGEKEEKKK